MDEPTYDAPPRRETYDPYSRADHEPRSYVEAPAYSDPRTASEVANLREEKINLMNELNEEIRSGNKLAQDYKSLEADYVKMRREFDRLNKRTKLDESSNEGESFVNRAPPEQPRQRTTEDYGRHREQAVRHSYNDVQPRHRDSLESENAKLREELARAYDII